MALQELFSLHLICIPCPTVDDSFYNILKLRFILELKGKQVLKWSCNVPGFCLSQPTNEAGQMHFAEIPKGYNLHSIQVGRVFEAFAWLFVFLIKQHSVCLACLQTKHAVLFFNLMD